LGFLFSLITIVGELFPTRWNANFCALNGVGQQNLLGKMGTYHTIFFSALLDTQKSFKSIIFSNHYSALCIAIRAVMNCKTQIFSVTQSLGLARSLVDNGARSLTLQLSGVDNYFAFVCM
jgi:hypothetical protein